MTDYKLWAFQDEDLTYLEPQLAALIKWDKGLGKTFGALERDRRARVVASETNLQWPTVIIAPLQTHDQWKDWLGRVHYDPPVYVFSEDRDKALWNLKKFRPGFYVLHWELLRHVNQKYWASRELFPVLSDKQHKFFHVISDETHRAQNRKSQQAKVLKKILSQRKTGTTGNPFTNKPHTLWSVLNWLYPKEYSSYWKFDAQYSIWNPVIRGSRTYREYVGPKNEQELVRRIAPFTVQRKKEDVFPDLPDRYYTKIKVDLDPKQRRAYDSMRRDMVAWVGANEQDPLVASATVAKLVRLQQFAIAHASINPDGTVTLSEPSSKLDAVMEQLDSMGDEKAVVFSQSKEGINLLATRLSKSGISYSIFHGDIGRDRKRIEKDRFINGDARVFLATGQSGGEGVDGLQFAASTLIRIDRSWLATWEDQEESRLHRPGQENATHIIDIVARDTVDQSKARGQERQRNWHSKIWDELKNG